MDQPASPEASAIDIQASKTAMGDVRFMSHSYLSDARHQRAVNGLRRGLGGTSASSARLNAAAL